MANATKGVPVTTTPWGDDKVRRGLAAVATTYYPGGMVALNASGDGVHCDDTAGIRFDGINANGFRVSVESDDIAGDKWLQVERPFRFRMAIATSVTAADIGRAVYAKYNNQVDFSTSNSILVGWIDAIVSATEVEILPVWLGRSGVATFDGATLTFSGSTGGNTVVVPDNLADALSIKEGSNAYITIVTTDSAELISVLKTLKFGGTTGNNIVALVDNLADALSVKEGSTPYLTFTTTNSGELINVLKTLKFGGTTGNNLISLVDNLASALDITEGANSYLKFVTTNSGEKVVATKPLDLAAVGTTAPAGSAQGDAAAIVNQLTTSTGDGTAGLVLPSAAAGLVRAVYNLHATAGLKIYPASGDDINDGTTDAAITIEGKTLAIFWAVDATTWAAIFTANS